LTLSKVFRKVRHEINGSRQSDAKNKIIAPVFKLLGIIDQWGNGLKLIADELKDYPDIEFRWREVGLSFQVQFFKLKHKVEHKQLQEPGQEPGQEIGQELGQEQKERTLFSLILQHLQIQPRSRNKLKEIFGLKKVSGYLNRTLTKLHSYNLTERTIPDNPNHPDEKFRITVRGIDFLHKLEHL